MIAAAVIAGAVVLVLLVLAGVARLVELVPGPAAVVAGWAVVAAVGIGVFYAVGEVLIS